MSLTLFIIAGTTLVVGGGIVAGSYYATEEERRKARIEEIKEEIKNCDVIISNFSNLKKKLQESKSYLNESKKDFTNGGHVLDGVPLANSEFNSCISKIESAINNANSIIKRYNNEKSDLNKEKTKLEAK